MQQTQKKQRTTKVRMNVLTNFYVERCVCRDSYYNKIMSSLSFFLLFFLTKYYPSGLVMYYLSTGPHAQCVNLLHFVLNRYMLATFYPPVSFHLNEILKGAQSKAALHLQVLSLGTLE